MNGANRWDVMSIREYQANGETKTSWTKIGVAFTNQNGSINVQLDAFPIDGKMQLQVPLTREQKEAMFNGRQGGGQRQEQRQNRQAQPPTGQGFNPRNAGGQQRQQAQQRFGQRGQSAPQQGSFGPPQQQYVPDAEVEQEEGWTVNGVWINDARNLPKDHPDYIPF